VDLSRYADLFLTESREHLSAINHALLQLERDSGGAEPVGAIFRAVHTVKGMSATMGYAAVAELSHEMETLLDRVRRGERQVNRAVMDVLFHAADALEAAIELSVAGREGEVDVAKLVGRLRALAEDEPALAPSAPAPSVAAPRAPARGRRGAAKRRARVSEWTAEAPAGVGLLVRVRIADGIPLRGVRAFLALQKAATLGEVTAAEPSVDALQADQFGGDFAFRLDTDASLEAIEEAVRSAGDVDRVEITGTESAVAGPPLGIAETASAAPSTATASEVAALRQQRHVRIDLRRLDSLMNLIGELVITRGRLAQIAGSIGDAALQETVTQASRLITDLQDEIMTSRMVPVWQVFDRFPRLVRDAARALGKEVEFTVEGKEIELDRSMLDEIGDPIVHLLRNAIDHGIEPPEQRATSSKPLAGRLALSAARDRSAVLIRVTDDGRGIDRERVLRRAIKMGLVDAGKTELSDDELLRLISRPGFSTAERVTDISGRGVGIDAVQNRVRALGGSVEIRSMPGQGTSVSVRLPLTLAIVRALLARIGSETYAIPLTHVNETVNLDGKTLQSVKGKELLMLRDDVLPLMRLRDVVQFGVGGAPPGQQVVVLELADRRAGLVVDQLSGQQEIVVKQFDPVRDGLSLFSGVTILGDGAPALIVDVGSLF
jgi:two-component system chemotaxis sensor kinase CheA